MLFHQGKRPGNLAVNVEEYRYTLFVYCMIVFVYMFKPRTRDLFKLSFTSLENEPEIDYFAMKASRRV